MEKSVYALFIPSIKDLQYLSGSLVLLSYNA